MHIKLSATVSGTLLALGLGVAGSALAASDTLSPGRQSGAPGTVVETESPAMPAAGFSKLDADGDGMISRSEGKKNKDVAKSWTQLDLNRDGKLDSMEFSQFELSPANATQKR